MSLELPGGPRGGPCGPGTVALSAQWPSVHMLPLLRRVLMVTPAIAPSLSAPFRAGYGHPELRMEDRFSCVLLASTDKKILFAASKTTKSL